MHFTSCSRYMYVNITKDIIDCLNNSSMLINEEDMDHILKGLMNLTYKTLEFQD